MKRDRNEGGKKREKLFASQTQAIFSRIKHLNIMMITGILTFCFPDATTHTDTIESLFDECLPQFAQSLDLQLIKDQAFTPRQVALDTHFWLFLCQDITKTRASFLDLQAGYPTDTKHHICKCNVWKWGNKPTKTFNKTLGMRHHKIESS